MLRHLTPLRRRSPISFDGDLSSSTLETSMYSTAHTPTIENMVRKSFSSSGPLRKVLIILVLSFVSYAGLLLPAGRRHDFLEDSYDDSKQRYQ